MKIMTNKRQIGIRIPCELDNLLENRVNKIGISKAAFILGLIYKELEKESLETTKPNTDNQTPQQK